MHVHIWPSRTRLVGRFLGGLGRGVEVVIYPHGLVRPGVRDARDVEHGVPVVLGVDAGEVQPPALRYEESKSHSSPPYSCPGRAPADTLRDGADAPQMTTDSILFITAWNFRMPCREEILNVI